MDCAGPTITLERCVTNLAVWSVRRGSDIPDDYAHSLRGEMIEWSEAERDEVRQLASKSSTASSGREMQSYQICGKHKNVHVRANKMIGSVAHHKICIFTTFLSP